MSHEQSARSVLMVSPASFGFDYQTAESNSFMSEMTLAAAEVTHQAMDEFRTAVETLQAVDIDVLVHDGSPDDYRPSAVFPNNWLSTWPDGTVYTYPMATASRRVERDQRVLEQLAASHRITNVVDLSEAEVIGQHLESTGAIVFDHLHRVAYGCISERCDETLFQRHAMDLGYEPVSFRGLDRDGVPIYHTNVMLAVQSTTAVACLDAIVHPAERDRVQRSLAMHHDVIDISFEQLAAFCANTLEVTNRQGEKFLIMSTTAYQAFTAQQRTILSRDKTIVAIDVPTIEIVGGGGIRCMLAEIFLPPLDAVHPNE